MPSGKIPAQHKIQAKRSLEWAKDAQRWPQKKPINPSQQKEMVLKLS